MNDKDLIIRWKRGQGHGGQHRNKTENCCVLTHRPSGQTVTVDGRSRERNLKQAKQLLKKRLHNLEAAKERARKKKDRDRKIKPGAMKRVRTYDYTKGTVMDHQSGKKASIKDVVDKGQIDKLR